MLDRHVILLRLKKDLDSHTCYCNIVNLEDLSISEPDKRTDVIPLNMQYLEWAD